MSADRRRFLQRLTLGGFALGALPASVHALAAPGADERVSGITSPDWREALLAGQPPQFDTTWTTRLTGKHRAVFDVPEIEGGSGVWRAGLWRNHYRDVLQAQPADLSPVLVIRHSAIPLIMTQQFWDTYDIGKSRKVMHPMTDKPTRRNPVLMNAEADGLPPMLAGITLDRQLELGTVVLACNLAFGDIVSMVSRRERLERAAARARALEMVHPGIILQPNGIFGVTLAQEHGCSFVAAS